MDSTIQLVLVFVAVAGVVGTITTWMVKRRMCVKCSVVKAERDSWRSIAVVAVENMEHSINRVRAAEGKGDFDVVPPAVKQELTRSMSELATMKTRLTAAVAALGIEPRK